jgi:uroporphyrinogen decarboxylase
MGVFLNVLPDYEAIRKPVLMAAMTSRQRVITALDHQEPDRVPFDCTFGNLAYSRLEKHLGFKPQSEVRPGGPALNVRPSVEFMQTLQVDLYYIGLSQAKNAPVFEYGMETYTDEWGVRYRKIENPSGFNYEVDSHPLMHAGVQDLGNYQWPDPDDPTLVDGLETRARDLYEKTELALVGKFSSSLFEQAFILRGMEQLLMDLSLNPDFACALMDKLADLAIKQIQAGLKVCGKYIQILRLAGDDMGHQRGTLLSPTMFRQIIKPRFARLYREAKSLFHQYNPNGKLMAHTDGDVYPLIPDYIEMGLDVLNPVQPYVTEMEHDRLKREFGDRLCFHGGMDIQRVLPFGKPDEVFSEAIKVMRALGSGGGLILAPTHYLLPDVPPENVMALRDAVLEFGRYPFDR